MMRNIAVIGCTGSIGVQSLEVLARHPQDFRVALLCCESNRELLLQQAAAHPRAALFLRAHPDHPALEGRGLSGIRAVLDMISGPDIDDVLVAASGFAGAQYALAAAEAGKRVLLANKETLVCAGDMFWQAIERGGGECVPIDSEHSAIFQCLGGRDAAQVDQLMLTCSGGPFYGWPREKLDKVTFDMTQRHPTWNMGWKITLDSATLFNKGMELLEAVSLFSLPPEKVEIVVHPQSILHSAVMYHDGSVVGQMGYPDMKMPIHVSLFWPRRVPSGLPKFSFAKDMTFGEPDEKAFPCLPLAREAAALTGGGLTYNAAGEVTAAAFRAGQIAFQSIGTLTERALQTPPGPARDFQDLTQQDQQIRAMVQSWIG